MEKLSYLCGTNSENRARTENRMFLFKDGTKLK